MKKVFKNSVKPLVVALIAAMLVFIDSLIAPLFLTGATFVWIAFINWNQFFGSNFIDRFKAIIGYIIGFFCANAMITIGNNIDNIFNVNLINISLGVILAVFIINFFMMYLEHVKKLFLDSIPGIIVGIAITFSGAGVFFSANDPKLLIIIIIYGILGLLSGLATNFFVQKINKTSN